MITAWIQRHYNFIVVLVGMFAALAGMTIAVIWLYAHAVSDAEDYIANTSLAALKSIESDLAKQMLSYAEDEDFDPFDDAQTALGLIKVDARGEIEVLGGALAFARQIQEMENLSNLFASSGGTEIISLDMMNTTLSNQSFRAFAIRVPDGAESVSEFRRYLIVPRNYFRNLINRLTDPGKNMTIILTDSNGMLVAAVGPKAPSVRGKPLYLKLPGITSNSPGQDLQHIPTLDLIDSAQNLQNLQQTLAVRGRTEFWPLEIVVFDDLRFWNTLNTGFVWILAAALPGAMFFGLIAWFLGRRNTNYREVNLDQRQRIERFREVLNTIQTGVIEWELDSGSVYYSEPWLKMLNFSAERHAGRLSAWRDRIHPDDKSRVLSAYQIALEGKETKLEQTYQLSDSNGVYMKVLEKALITRNKKGDAERVLVIQSRI